MNKPIIRYDWATGKWKRVSILQRLLDIAIDFELKGART